jgi:membrane protease YdiL (CAAX protease family)
MNKLADWIKSHPLIGFYVIAFAITWGLGFSYDAVLKQGQFTLAPVVSLATCGPALAGIVVSAVSDTQPRSGTRRAFWVAFAVAWVVSALVFVAGLTIGEHMLFSPVLFVFAFVAVVPVAFVIGAAYLRSPAVREYLSSLIRLRGVWGWALVALTLVPGLLLLSNAVSMLLGRQPTGEYDLPASGLALAGWIAVKFIYQLFFFNATGEEVGWRGFVLPRLQTRTSPLIAALIIALFWAPWHFFLWQAEGQPVLTLSFWIYRYIGLGLLSVYVVWVCNRAKGSILVAGIAHAASNVAEALIPLEDGLVFYPISLAAALAMIVADRMWAKWPLASSVEHRAVYQEPDPNG